jgi:hypothetical protein
VVAGGKGGRVDAEVVVAGGREWEAAVGGGGGYRLEEEEEKWAAEEEPRGRGREPSGGGPMGASGRGQGSRLRGEERGRGGGLPARVREGRGVVFYTDVTLGQLGQLGRWSVVPAHGPRCARRFRAVLGWHYELRLQSSTSPT